MAYTAIPSVVTGQTYPASAYNTYLKGNLDALWVYTTQGDIVYASSSSALQRLGLGTAGQVLRVNAGATAPEWGSIATAPISRRQGGHATNWSTSGTTNYTPATSIIQVGSYSFTLPGGPVNGISGSLTITFPVAFSASPLIFLALKLNSSNGNAYRDCEVSSRTASSFYVIYDLYNPNYVINGPIVLEWMAVGAP
jgi:hypothetical protein